MKIALRFWLRVVAPLACALGAILPSAHAAPSGYWKYVSFDVSPRPEEAPKPLPGRLHEQHAKGSVDIPGGKASISSIWKTDDVDRRPYLMEGSFGIVASQTLAALVPGTKITLTGSASVTGNPLAAAMPAGGHFGVVVHLGENVVALGNVRIGQSTSGKGEFTVFPGVKGEKIAIVLSSQLSSNGAFGSKLLLRYEFQEGPPPPDLTAVPTTGSGATASGSASGTSAGSGSTAAGSTATGAGTASTGQNAGSASAASGSAISEPANVARMTLQAGRRKVSPGQTVTVPVWLLKAQGVANMNFNVRSDPTVATATSAFSKGNLLDRAIFQANPGEPGLVRVGFAQNSDLAGDGTVVQLTFQAKGRPGSRTPLTLEVTTISGTAGGKPTVELIHGEIVIVGPDGTLPGDSDGDNQITARDAADALKMSVKLIPENRICDVDADGQVTSTDARLILAKASGK